LKDQKGVLLSYIAAKYETSSDCSFIFTLGNSSNLAAQKENHNIPSFIEKIIVFIIHVDHSESISQI